MVVTFHPYVYTAWVTRDKVPASTGAVPGVLMLVTAVLIAYALAQALRRAAQGMADPKVSRPRRSPARTGAPHPGLNSCSSRPPDRSSGPRARRPAREPAWVRRSAAVRWGVSSSIPSAVPSASAQRETLRACTLLHALRPAADEAWPGALILGLHLDDPGIALSFAANIAGAVCLTLEPDPSRTRAALRLGACDFVVNTLDEALRAIKNEIRQRRPLSVALQAPPSAMLSEIIARGLAPQLFTAAAEEPDAAASLAAFGTRSLDLSTPPTSPALHAPSAAAVLQGLLNQPPWNGMSFATVAFATPAELRAFDTRALSLLSSGSDDTLRRRWLAHAPRLFPRDRTRILWLTPAESAELGLPLPHSATAALPSDAPKAP